MDVSYNATLYYYKAAHKGKGFKTLNRDKDYNVIPFICDSAGK